MGMGATLQMSGQFVFVEFFSIPIDPKDEDTLDTSKGSCDGQQV